jgi:hypothetical protein
VQTNNIAPCAEGKGAIERDVPCGAWAEVYSLPECASNIAQESGIQQALTWPAGTLAGKGRDSREREKKDVRQGTEGRIRTTGGLVGWSSRGVAQ